MGLTFPSCVRGCLVAAAAAMLAVSGCEQEPEPLATSTATAEWREFGGAWNASGTRRTIPLGVDRQGSIIHLSGSMLLAGSGRPGVGFHAEVIALVDSQTGLLGRGVWTDDRGDQVFSELTGEGTKESNRIFGTIVGGTGRHSGAAGSYEFSWQYVLESEAGEIHGRAVGLKGRYRQSEPEAGDPEQ